MWRNVEQHYWVSLHNQHGNISTGMLLVLRDDHLESLCSSNLIVFPKYFVRQKYDRAGGISSSGCGKISLAHYRGWNCTITKKITFNITPKWTTKASFPWNPTLQPALTVSISELMWYMLMTWLYWIGWLNALSASIIMFHWKPKRYMTLFLYWPLYVI